MLTKEVCMSACAEICEDCQKNHEKLYGVKGMACAFQSFDNEDCPKVAVFKQLIKEHFDNSPLSFDDLEEDMWVWDNREKKYEKIHDTKLSPHIQFGRSEAKVRHVLDMGWCITFFRENRFYRRQKED